MSWSPVGNLCASFRLYTHRHTHTACVKQGCYCRRTVVTCLCVCALTPIKSLLLFCITMIAGQCHNWYAMKQQAETDSERLPLKKQTQQKRSDSRLQINANLGEWNGENNSICNHLLQSAKENWAQGKAWEGWELWCLSPWAGLQWQAPR